MTPSILIFVQLFFIPVLLSQKTVKDLKIYGLPLVVANLVIITYDLVFRSGENL
jgi:hypothetical protein